MLEPISQQPTRLALARIGEATHCQAGATIALSAALAAALGQATANGSLADGAVGGASDAAHNLQTALADARLRLQAIADEDARAITQFVEMRNRGQALKGYELLCDGPREIADLAISAAQAMQTYRPHVCERTQDDLEFAITLMAGAARAAVQLLDSNLRIWPLPELLAGYGPHVTRLESAITHLQPVASIREAHRPRMPGPR
jgi:hypothetical protein